jgi:cation:H+ antiporter
MLLQIGLIILGFILLIKGADFFVKGASSLAKKYNVSDLIIGLTVVAFGTSAPELVVNSIASTEAHHAIIYGNVIGSNNFNIFIILGIAGIITPMVVQTSTVWKEIPFALFSLIVFYVFTSSWFISPLVISRLEGVLLLFLFVLFLTYIFWQIRKSPSHELPETDAIHSNKKIWLFVLSGVTGLIIGGRLIVTNSVALATAFGISERVIGLTIVAAGTSLPELATSVVAALKKNNDIAVGNIIGSNIFNIFLILGVSSLINPLEYDVALNNDLYILSIGTIILFLAMFTGKRKKLDRWEAIVLFILYSAYTVYILI